MLPLPAELSENTSIYAHIALTEKACNFKTLLPRHCQAAQGRINKLNFGILAGKINHIQIIAQESARIFNEKRPFDTRVEADQKEDNPIFKCQNDIFGSVTDLDKSFGRLNDLDAVGRANIFFGCLKTALYLVCVAAVVFGSLKLGGWKAIALSGGFGGTVFLLNLIRDYRLNKTVQRKLKCWMLPIPALIELVINPVLFISRPTKKYNLKCRTVEAIHRDHALLIKSFNSMVTYFNANHEQLRSQLNAKDSPSDIKNAFTELNRMCDRLGIKY